MKSYFDSFYEIIHKNSVKRRRMVSLLLVLSIFVSSGVLWELRDTVVTLVNEPLCGFEEHVHSDECYETRLICGLEENEEHTHTDECYEKVLVCGYDEHLHTTLCYTDEELPDSSMQSDDEESNIVSIDLPEDENEEQFISQADEAAKAALRLGNAMRASLADDPTELVSPAGVSTIDNIARGINITLFDYHDPEDELESKLNNYDISWNSSNHTWEHNNIKYAGVNYGRNPTDDIMFFAYGTPDFVGTNADNDDNDHYGDYYYNVYSRTQVDQISKNNYSGDYNTNNRYSSKVSGNRPIQGIVQNQLVGGYPVMNNTKEHSLDYLFSETPSAYKTVYTDVNHFLQDKNGHLVYNSDKNYAYYNQDTHNFTIYESTYHIINNDHHRDKDYNALTETEYDGANGGEFKIGFFPFDQYDLSRKDPNFNGNGFNHHFGMKMDARFKNLSSPSEPIVFKYSGDDDMWVFVDDVLVLDIGGIHEPAAGMIDFTNGLVWTQDNELGSVAETEYNNLRNSNPSLPAYADIPKPDNGVNTDGASESEWKVETLASKFAGIEGKSCDAKDNKAHTIEMFYLERGGCYSNLAIDMNLPTVRPLTVTKNVDFGSHYSNDYDRNDVTDSPKYQFAVYVEDPVDSDNYVLADLGDDEDNPFYLKDGERKDFYLADETRKYYVVENGIDTNIYSNVLVNTVAQPIESGNASSGTPTALNVTDTYNFTNVVREEKEPLNVSKSWIDSDGKTASPPDYTIKFKLYRSDNGGEPQPVEIGGKMTFMLNSDNEWTWTSPQLPTRYGSHIYTYSVEELNVPDGYKASYSKNADGGLVITNKDVTNADIYLKKEWSNAIAEDQKPVTLTLKRKKAVYEVSQPTSLRINLLDAGGNLLTTYEVQKTDNMVYAGGSVEFSFDAPNGVEYYTVDTNYPQLTPNTIHFQQISDRTFEISDLAADNGSDFANEVSIKVYTDEAQDSLLLLHHSFTRWTDGWIPNGGSEILTSSYNAYAKGDGMLIRGPNDTNRTASNQGARLDLDPLMFKVNHTYTFSTYVRFDEEGIGADDGHGGKYIVFKFTLYDGLGNEESNYHVIEQTNVYSGQWTHLMGTVTLPEDINPYGMYLIVESFDPPGQPFIGPSKFRMDEFTAIEGNHAMNVEETTGKVTVGTKTYYDSDFSKGTENWEKFANNNLQITNTKQYSDRYYLRVSERTANYQGAKISLSNLNPGKTYKVHAVISGDRADGDRDFKITFNDGDGNNTPVKQADTVTDYTWAIIDTDFTIPSTAVKDEMFMYVESGDAYPYRIYEFKISDIEPTENKEGYTLSNGTYTSNYSQYSLAIDSASATNPLHLQSDYTYDTTFSKTINLNSTDGWDKHLGKTDLEESSDHYIRYIYYVEETGVDGMVSGVDYIVSYENNNVATNDADTPIIVKNKCIRYRLPETGGSGTDRIYFFGFVLTAIGIISGSALYRRKRRRV